MYSLQSSRRYTLHICRSTLHAKCDAADFLVGVSTIIGTTTSQPYARRARAAYNARYARALVQDVQSCTHVRMYVEAMITYESYPVPGYPKPRLSERSSERGVCYACPLHISRSDAPIVSRCCRLGQYGQCECLPTRNRLSGPHRDLDPCCYDSRFCARREAIGYREVIGQY